MLCGDIRTEMVEYEICFDRSYAILELLVSVMWWITFVRPEADVLRAGSSRHSVRMLSLMHSVMHSFSKISANIAVSRIFLSYTFVTDISSTTST